MKEYIACLKKYATFSGRARRREYWMFALFNLIFAFVAEFIDGILGSCGAVHLIYSLAVLIPSWAVFFRRLHDTGHSGWCWLWGLLPIVGWIVLLVFLCTDSIPAENAYGPSPKAVA